MGFLIEVSRRFLTNILGLLLLTWFRSRLCDRVPVVSTTCWNHQEKPCLLVSINPCLLNFPIDVLWITPSHNLALKSPSTVFTSWWGGAHKYVPTLTWGIFGHIVLLFRRGVNASQRYDEQLGFVASCMEILIHRYTLYKTYAKFGLVYTAAKVHFARMHTLLFLSRPSEVVNGGDVSLTKKSPDCGAFSIKWSDIPYTPGAWLRIMILCPFARVVTKMESIVI